ncbi:hypothetical protein [Bifidobacterium ruminantium]|jgi:hypothetical protein|nr:hypothetical protein [Bifidobacterium ruminantium]
MLKNDTPGGNPSSNQDEDFHPAFFVIAHACGTNVIFITFIRRGFQVFRR